MQTEVKEIGKMFVLSWSVKVLATFVLVGTEQLLGGVLGGV
jgi:hypothetical protein